MAEDTKHCGCRTQESQAGTELEVASLIASFQSTSRYYIGHWGEGSINGLTQSLILRATTPTCQARCLCWCNSGLAVIGATNHVLIRFEAQPIHREIMFGTINLAKSPWLGKPQGQNYHFWLAKWTQYQMLSNHSCLCPYTGQRYSQSEAEQLLFAIGSG